MLPGAESSIFKYPQPARKDGREKHMVARDLMQKEVLTVSEDDLLADLCDLLQQAHIHGAPVVAKDGRLVGFVSQEDVLFGSMSGPPRDEDGPGRGEESSGVFRPTVRDIMTSPAVSAMEDTGLRDVCRMMWRLRLHHLPIVNEGKVTGIVSSLDLCRAISDGQIPI